MGLVHWAGHRSNGNQLFIGVTITKHFKTFIDVPVREIRTNQSLKARFHLRCGHSAQDRLADTSIDPESTT
jgi:hypothetical protein